jgi:S-adenosylmethionine:tRNA ribosyltransferase-isomerase
LLLRLIYSAFALSPEGLQRLETAAVFQPSDFFFDLPPELIAQEATVVRDASRLLIAASLVDTTFADLAAQLPDNAVLVVNDTKVLAARVFGQKVSGGSVELLFLQPESVVDAQNALMADCSAWRCLAKARRALRAGQVVMVGRHELRLLSDRADDGTIVVSAPGDGLAFLQECGRLPLPPYIARDKAAPQDPADAERYQTMFAAVPGAVAAPTAGLHMTPAVQDSLTARGITVANITLHVGWGTFAPIRVDDIRSHQMHAERYVIPARTAELIASGRPIVALGTTTLRALESAAIADHQVAVGPGSTSIFIYPGSGHRFAIVSHLITNFHLPESTLLMLVCAFAGDAIVASAYRHAIAQRYRFFSFGDAMLLSRAPDTQRDAALTFTARMTS